MSSDPKIIQSPKLLPEINVNTLVGLADSGAKFIHAKALKYKPKDIDVKVMSNKLDDLSKPGTLIKDALAWELDAEIASPNPIAEVTVIGKGISGNTKIITEMIEKVRHQTTLLAMSMNTNSIIFYVAQENNVVELFNQIHQITISNKETIAMAVKKDLTFIQTSGVGLEETHGIIGKISEDPKTCRHQHFRHLNYYIQHLAVCRLERKRKSSKTYKSIFENTISEMGYLNQGKTRRMKKSSKLITVQ